VWRRCGTSFKGDQMTALAESAARRIAIKELGRAPRTGPQQLSLDSTVTFLRSLDRCFVRLNEGAGLQDRLEVLVRETALQQGFATYIIYLHSTIESAAGCALATWSTTARLLAEDRNDFAHEKRNRPTVDALSTLPEGRFREYLSTFNLALAEILREHAVEPGARVGIRELLERLGLSYDELGQALHVSGETVRRWERGVTSVPSVKVALIESAGEALRRILRVVRPEALPSVIRRPAQLFDGALALDWIRTGRIGDVANRYEATFAYQG
ncbi:MAG: helix-turn-helix domain-containing protein, partial [bacterium]